MKQYKKNCYIFVFDDFSDWEASLVLPGLCQYGEFDVFSFSTVNYFPNQLRGQYETDFIPANSGYYY